MLLVSKITVPRNFHWQTAATVKVVNAFRAFVQENGLEAGEVIAAVNAYFVLVLGKIFVTCVGCCTPACAGFAFVVKPVSICQPVIHLLGVDAVEHFAELRCGHAFPEQVFQVVDLRFLFFVDQHQGSFAFLGDEQFFQRFDVVAGKCWFSCLFFQFVPAADNPHTKSGAVASKKAFGVLAVEKIFDLLAVLDVQIRGKHES